MPQGIGIFKIERGGILIRGWPLTMVKPLYFTEYTLFGARVI